MIMEKDVQYRNKAYSEGPAAFSRQRPFHVRQKNAVWNGGHTPTPGYAAVELSREGDITLRFPAPGASSVTVASGHISNVKFEIALKKGENGVFEGVLPAALGLAGNVQVVFEVDGCEVVNPYLQVEFGDGRISNFLELPDPETPYIEIRKVPHGTVHREVFWSDSIEDWACCLVYTPPQYEEGMELPVLYLQHGGGENETAWVYSGKVNNILDNLLSEGKCVPFVVVMNDAQLKKPGDTGMNDFDGIEGVITEDCRKYIEQKYRVRKDKWGRAIAGLSLGSMEAVYIGLRHPELFGYIGSFTYLRCRDKDNTYQGNPHLDALKDAAQFAKDYKLLFRSLGGAEYHMNEFEEDDAFLAQYGIDRLPCYERRIYPGQSHVWNCWRRAIHDFAQLVFKD